jgi:hypothetical protein
VRYPSGELERARTRTRRARFTASTASSSSLSVCDLLLLPAGYTVKEETRTGTSPAKPGTTPSELCHGALLGQTDGGDGAALRTSHHVEAIVVEKAEPLGMRMGNYTARVLLRSSLPGSLEGARQLFVFVPGHRREARMRRHHLLPKAGRNCGCHVHILVWFKTGSTQNTGDRNCGVVRSNLKPIVARPGCLAGEGGGEGGEEGKRRVLQGRLRTLGRSGWRCSVRGITAACCGRKVCSGGICGEGLGGENVRHRNVGAPKDRIVAPSQYYPNREERV